MKKKYLLPVFCFFWIGIYSLAWGQEGPENEVSPKDQVTALQAELEKVTADSSRIRILLAIQKLAAQITPASLLKNASLQLMASPLLADQSLKNQFVAYYYTTDCYLRFKNFDSAWHFILIADSISKLAKDPMLTIPMMHMKGILYSSDDNLEMTEKTFLEMVKLAEPYPKHQGRILHAYNTLGNQSFVHGNLVKASRFYLKMLEASEGIDNTEARLSAAINLANVQMELGQTDPVFQYAEEALCLAHEKNDIKRLARAHSLMANAWRMLDSIPWAKRYAQKSLAYSQELYKEYTVHASSYKLLGLLEQDEGNYEQAIVFQKKVQECLRKPYNKVIYLSDKETQAQNLMELSISYRMLNRYPLSLQHLDSALKVNLEFRNTQQLADIHRNYALTYAQIGNFKKAYEHEVLAVKNEKINKEEQDRHLIEDMKTRYESLTKDQMITELETEKLKEEAKRSRNINQRNYLIISLLFSTFLFSSFIYYLQQRRKKEHIIGRQKLELQNLRIDDLLNEQAANSMSSLLEGQEKERKRVALDLHDRMGSLLAMVKLHLTEGSKMALPLLEKAITEVRKISHNLASNTLDDFGLSVALAELKKMVEESGKVAFTLHTYKIDKRFPAHIEINLYRIIQELINNSLKHAEPGKISLSLTRREDAISLVYEDNGQGFNLEQALHQTGIGLWNVQNRADQMGGKLHINTQPGKGMEVILEIPLNEQKTL